MRKLLTGAALWLCGAFLLAQNDRGVSPGLTPVETIVTVEARQGTRVPSLSREDIIAYERDQRLRVTGLVPCQGENAGLELFLLLDDASSTRLGSQFGDLRRFIDAQPVATAIGIAYMHHGTVEIMQSPTEDREAAKGALRIPQASGGASPYQSLSELIKRWHAGSVRREVVFVTNGVDFMGHLGPSNPNLDAAIQDAQRNRIVVYSVYFPAAGQGEQSPLLMNWAQSYLARVAEKTGGKAYMSGFGAPVSIAPYLRDIGTDLSHQYRAAVLFPPEAQAAFRQVRLKTEVPNVSLTAASSVWVPAAHGESKK
jgi:hypothetical protein